MDVTVRYDQQGEIEALYGNPVNINPIIFSPGDGIVIFGQKTQQSKPSALDRINVRRLIITFERAAKQFLKYKLFELNNQYTRLDIETAINQYLTTVQAQNGVYTFKTVCDETNNTPQIIDSNQLNVDVYLQPEKDAEFIQLQNIITATGANFQVIQRGFNLSIAQQ
jgi:phage tail sheath protein FI